MIKKIINQTNNTTILYSWIILSDVLMYRWDIIVTGKIEAT